MNELYGIVSLGGTVIGGSLYQRGLKGETGNGIASVVMESNYDLTITYTNGDVVTLDTGLDEYQTIIEGIKAEAEAAQTAAETAETNAAASESAANVSATRASSNALVASNAASNAYTSAQNAQGYANAALGYVRQANGYSNEAQGYASTAESAKTDAETAADNAATSETNAATSESNASDSATSAAESATNARRSWARAEDNAVAALESSEFSNQCMMDSLQYSLKSEGYANGEQNGTPVTSDSPYYHNNAKYYSEQLDTLLPTETASGAIVSFPDGQSAFPMKSLKVNLEPIQDLSNGDPSPSNICPIYGHDSVGATRAGKNILPLPTLQGYWSIADGSFGSSTQWVSCQKIKVNPNTQYHLSSTFVTRWCGVCAYDANGSYLGGIGETAQSADHAIDLTITTPSNCAYIGVCMANPSRGSQTIRPSDVTDLQLELGLTATAYEPYQGESYTTDLGQTVYGGTVDWVSGELVIDRAITLVTETSSLAKDSDQAGYHRFYMAKNDIEKRIDYRGHIIANACPTVYNYANFGTFDGEMAVTAYSITSYPSNYLYIISKSLSTVAEVQAQFADEPLQVVYRLATPQTIQLTPQQIQTLVGVNNVWSEQGNVDVTYKADIQLYIDKKTNELAVAIAAL